MQSWNGPHLAPSRHEPILVIGEDAPIRRALAKEVEALPAPTLLANSLADAIGQAAEFDRTPSILLVPEARIDADFETALAELRIRAGAKDLVPIAFGRSPNEERRREIRNAGVDLALFGRFGRHALRFQINRALSPSSERSPRGERRAPMEWRTRTYSSGKEKSARCYSLSSGGAYFVTPRPWVVGSDVSLELPVGRDRLLVSGRIVYTNVGDSRNGLPRGMAVAFRPLSEHIQQVIRQDVTTTHEALRV